MVYMFDLSDEPDRTLGTSNVYMGQYEWIAAKPASEVDGLAEGWMKEYYPTEIVVDPNEYPLKDLLKTQGMFCVSNRFKDLIELIEPSTHQFLPVKVIYGDFKSSYFFLKFGISEDCYNLERSDVQWREIKSKSLTINVWSKKPLKPLVLEKYKIKGKHLWQNLSGQNLKFMSGDLYELLIEKNISGIKFEKQIVEN